MRSPVLGGVRCGQQHSFQGLPAPHICITATCLTANPMLSSDLLKLISIDLCWVLKVSSSTCCQPALESFPFRWKPLIYKPKLRLSDTSV